jgi:hypothetical protein
MRLLAVIAFALPQHGVFVPFRSLGGVKLGATQAQVARAWGSHGVCRRCALPTWYFNYKPFTQQGAAVTFSRGRAVALTTLWQPQGWHTPNGLLLGDQSARVTAVYGGLATLNCGGYTAYTLTRGKVTSAFYVVEDKLWGFGLSRAPAPVCP